MKWGRENGSYAWGTIKIQVFITQTLWAAAKAHFVYLQVRVFFSSLFVTEQDSVLVQNKTNITFLEFLPLA